MDTIAYSLAILVSCLFFCLFGEFLACCDFLLCRVILNMMLVVLIRLPALLAFLFNVSAAIIILYRV